MSGEAVVGVRGRAFIIQDRSNLAAVEHACYRSAFWTTPASIRADAMPADTLLDPKNDYVFKRVFGEAPELVVALINDLRPDLPEIRSVEILNPGINAEELSGKYIVLDVLARDADGHSYNVEIQVRRYGAWNARALYYLARLLSQQLNTGEDYDQLRAAVGIHLLDFDLFKDTEAQRAQALWRFEMRDAQQPEVTLGNRLQLTLIELKKADRLSRRTRSPDTASNTVPSAPSPPPSASPKPALIAARISAWVTFFEHWREEQTMAHIDHAPIQDALNRVRQLSADEEARRLAFVRERAQRDELSLLKEAREEGRQEGEQIGLQRGRQETARHLIELGLLNDVQIAQATGLSVAQIEALRTSGAP